MKYRHCLFYATFVFLLGKIVCAQPFTHFFADFEFDYGLVADGDTRISNKARLDDGTDVGYWTVHERASSAVELSMRGEEHQYWFPRSGTNDPPYRITAHLDTEASLARGVELSFMARLHAAADFMGDIDKSRHFIEVRDTGGVTLLTLAISGVASEDEELVRLEYRIGDDWVTVSTELQRTRSASPFFNAGWNPIHVVMREASFDIRMADTRNDPLNTLVSDVSWSPATGSKIGSLFFTTVDTGEEEFIRRIRYDTIRVSSFPVEADPRLPFREDFERLLIGDVHAQNGWIREEGIADIQSFRSRSGLQSLELRDGMVSRNMRTDESMIWVRFHALLTAPPETQEMMEDQDTLLSFYINPDLEFVVLDGVDAVVLPEPLMPLDEWVQFDVFCDLENRTWMLGINGQTWAENLALHTVSYLPRLGALDMSGDPDIFVDDVFVDDVEPLYAAEVDVDGDGLPDWWEHRYFGGITQADADGTTPSGRLLREAYIAGLDPHRSDDRFVVHAIAPGRWSWDRHPARVYDIYWTPSLTMPDGWRLIAAGHPDSLFEESDEARLAHDAGFYRIGVRKPDP